MGKQDVVKHSRTQSHLDQARAMNSQSKLTFAGQSLDEVVRRTAAELKMAVVAAASYIPLAFHNKLSPIIRNIFQIPSLPQSTTQHQQKLPAC